MIDEGLINKLNALNQQRSSVARLPPDVAQSFVDRLATTFVIDKTCLHWWGSLSVNATFLSYVESDGLSKVSKLLSTKKRAMLVVTDDEFPPWPVYSGDVRELIAILGECRYFEYILADETAGWIIFDTHDNQLVIAGLIADEIRV